MGPKGRWQTTIPSGSPRCSCTKITCPLLQQYLTGHQRLGPHPSSRATGPAALGPPARHRLAQAMMTGKTLVLHDIAAAIHSLGSREPRHAPCTTCQATASSDSTISNPRGNIRSSFRNWLKREDGSREVVTSTFQWVSSCLRNACGIIPLPTFGSLTPR